MNNPPVLAVPIKNSGLRCEKCAGNMWPIKVYRLSGCLVAIGFTLLIPALLLLLFITATAILGTFGSSLATDRIAERARTNTVARLAAVSNIPPAYVDSVRTNDFASAAWLDVQLPESVQAEVKPIMLDYKQQMQFKDSFRGGMVLGSGVILIIAYVVLIPTFIIGFLLILRKKVWRCSSCGFIFDRA